MRWYPFFERAFREKTVDIHLYVFSPNTLRICELDRNFRDLSIPLVSSVKKLKQHENELSKAQHRQLSALRLEVIMAMGGMT